MASSAASALPVLQGARLLAVFASFERAEHALKKLRRAGFGASRLSVIAKDDATASLGRQAWWTRLGAELAGMVVVSVPGIGRVVALGPITWSHAAPGLGNMLMRAGISARTARTYESALRGGQTLVLIHGSAHDVLRARGVMRAQEPS